jgi:riboflavin synthase
MFTGLVEELGTITAVENEGSNVHFTAQADLIMQDIHLGDSIAIDGVCQTVTDFDQQAKTFKFTAIQETLKVTNFGEFKVGTEVNLERCLKAETRLGGHIVQGHVDCVAKLIELTDNDGSYTLRFKIPEKYSKYMIPKGSICVSGISLTVVEANQDNFTVCIIPKTWEVTSLKALKVDDLVNIEVDVLAKYIERLTAAAQVANS